MPVTLPEQFEEFSAQQKKGFLAVKALKDQGKQVCGAFCQYTPAEIIMAAGLTQVILCGRSHLPIKTAETQLPANLCPLIKASYGHVLEDSCPYAYFSDVVVGETTCAGKKKMYELLAQKKMMQCIHLPNLPDYERSLEMWTEELRAFTRGMEEKFNVKITDEMLNEAIKWCNQERRQTARLYELGKLDPPAITGYQMQQVEDGQAFIFDRDEKLARLTAVNDQIEQEWKEGKYAMEPDPYRPRLLVSGTGLAAVTEKTIKVAEELGAQIVCYEGCNGIAARRRLIDEDESRDPMVRIAEKYIEVPCAVVSPNNRRMEQVAATIDEWSVDGYLALTLHSCNPFAIETENVRRVCEKKDVPLLHISTDFTPGDEGQIRTRLQAFIEMIRAKKEAKLNG